MTFILQFLPAFVGENTIFLWKNMQTIFATWLFNNPIPAENVF
jgi:hypothetical protein